ncbi:hypothetical protein CR513_01604, partial [Mucuna pruriens]
MIQSPLTHTGSSMEGVPLLLCEVGRTSERNLDRTRSAGPGRRYSYHAYQLLPLPPIDIDGRRLPAHVIREEKAASGSSLSRATGRRLLSEGLRRIKRSYSHSMEMFAFGMKMDEQRGKHGIGHYTGGARHDRDLRFKLIRADQKELRLPDPGHNLPRDGEPLAPPFLASPSCLPSSCLSDSSSFLVFLIIQNSGAFDQDVLASPVWALARIGTFMRRCRTSFITTIHHQSHSTSHFKLLDSSGSLLYKRKAFQLQRQVSRVRKEFDCWDGVGSYSKHSTMNKNLRGGLSRQRCTTPSGLKTSWGKIRIPYLK